MSFVSSFANLLRVTTGNIDSQNQVFANNQSKMGLLNDAANFATGLAGDIFSPKYNQWMNSLAAQDKSLMLRGLTAQTQQKAYEAELEGAKKQVERDTGKDSTFSAFA